LRNSDQIRIVYNFLFFPTVYNILNIHISDIASAHMYINILIFCSKKMCVYWPI